MGSPSSACWLLFAVLDGASEPGTVVEKMVSVLMHLVFVVPFGVGAWAAGRWPRPTGWLGLVRMKEEEEGEAE